MNPLKKLAGQTVVYGLSSIVGRLLNFLLVPLYTHVFMPAEYGVVTELFAYVVFLQVILTYGMETGFFRFSQKEYSKDLVYTTSLTSLFSTSIVFLIAVIIFSQDIATYLGYSNNVNYILWFALIISLDAVTAIPFARLRQQNKAMKFATFKLINIALNIGLNLFFLLICKDSKIDFLNRLYISEIGVGYIFISNLVASAATLLMFVPELLKIRIKFDIKLLKLMLIYSLPLLISGLAGTINEALDRVVLKFWLTIPENTADPHNYIMYQIGIYGANSKIAVLMTLFVQTFRYAADPFYFAQAKETNYQKTFADIMKYFILLGLLIFLGVMLYIDIVKYFISPKYFEGLAVVAPLLLGHLFVGVVYNLSFWYKLKDMTRLGIIIFVIGSLITIIMNYILIPKIGYLGSAWANVGCYSVMMIITYLWGQKHLPINYDLKRIFAYFVFAIMIYISSIYLKTDNKILNFGINTALFISFVSVAAYFEKINVLIVAIRKIITKRQK